MSRKRDIFLEALEQPSPEARAAFVERSTAGDPKLRQSLEELLAKDQGDTFLQRGAVEHSRVDGEGGQVHRWRGERRDSIDQYKLLEAK